MSLSFPHVLFNLGPLRTIQGMGSKSWWWTSQSIPEAECSLPSPWLASPKGTESHSVEIIPDILVSILGHLVEPDHVAAENVFLQLPL